MLSLGLWQYAFICPSKWLRCSSYAMMLWSCLCGWWGGWWGDHPHSTGWWGDHPHCTGRWVERETLCKRPPCYLLCRGARSSCSVSFRLAPYSDDTGGDGHPPYSDSGVGTVTHGTGNHYQWLRGVLCPQNRGAQGVRQVVKTSDWESTKKYDCWKFNFEFWRELVFDVAAPLPQNGKYRDLIWEAKI